MLFSDTSPIPEMRLSGSVGYFVEHHLTDVGIDLCMADILAHLILVLVETLNSYCLEYSQF